MSDATSGNADQGSLPNLYQLLQLQPLDDDRQRIEAALKNCMAQARQLRDSAPSRAQQLARIVELGKKYLLSTERKQQYDARWRTQYQKPAPAEMVGAGAVGGRANSVSDSLASLLPAGDPYADFDLAGYLESMADVSPSDQEAEFQKLMGLLAPSSPTIEATAVSKPIEFAGIGSQAGQTPQPRAARPSSGRSLAAEMRSNRDRKLLSTIGGVLVSLATLLGLLFYLLRQPPESEQLAGNAPAAQVAAVEPTPAQENPQVPQRGSGLPRVRGMDASNDAENRNASGISESFATEDAVPSSGNNETGQMPEADNGMNEEMDMSLTMSEVPMTDEGMSSDGMPAVGTTTDMPTDMAAETSMQPTAPAVPVELSADEKREWKEKMQEVRQLLVEKDFATARSQLTAVDALAKSAEQRAQFGRLQTLATLAEDFQNALIAAVTGLSAGEVITVKSTALSFIEGTPEQLIAKVDGQRQVYDLRDMPVGLANGLADLKLDLVHPASSAKKAAYVAVLPRPSDLAIEQAKKMMQEAIDGGVVAEDMLLVYEDDYTLE